MFLQSFLRRATHHSPISKLGICSLHNRNRLSDELSISNGSLRCKTNAVCILENSGGNHACFAHRRVRNYSNLIQCGEIMICNGLLRCDEMYEKCAIHGKLRLKTHMHPHGENMWKCQQEFHCENRILCNFHREYRYMWHLVKYKNSYICRHDFRCKTNSGPRNAVPVETFIFFDELWGTGEDKVIHRITGNTNPSKPIVNMVNDANKGGYSCPILHDRHDYLRDTCEWRKKF